MFADHCISCGKGKSTANREHLVRDWCRRLTQSSRFPIVFRLVEGLPLCAICLERLPVIGETICLRCGRDMGKQPLTGDWCQDCTDAAPAEPLTANRALLQYNQWGKELLSRYKYRGDERLAVFYASLLLIAYHRYYWRERFQLITYVPLHPTRLAERGFHQVEVLAQRVGKAIRVPVQALLVRSRQTEKLSRQGGRASRLESLQHAFTLHPGGKPHTADRAGKSILLIDDIFTTGSTLRSCAAALRSDPMWRDVKIFSLTIYR